MTLFILFILLLVETSTNDVIRKCVTHNDCGLGGACVNLHGSNQTLCDCRISDMAYVADEEGFCNKLVKDYCDVFPPRFKPPYYNTKSVTKICMNEGHCLLTFLSFYCQCTEKCFKRHCEECDQEHSFGQAGIPHIAFSIKANPLQDRTLLWCYNSMGFHFRAFVMLWRAERGLLITQRFTIEDFIIVENANKRCLDLGITNDVCDFIPSDRPLFCAEHSFMMPYTKFMGMRNPDPKRIFYRMYGDSGIIPPGTLKGHKMGIFRNFFFDSVIGFNSDYELGTHICTPLISLINGVGGSHETIYQHVSQSLAVRVNITFEERCKSDLVSNLFLRWMLYRVQHTFAASSRKRIFRSQLGGRVYHVDRYGIDVDSMNRLEIWTSAKVLINGSLRSYRNFEFDSFGKTKFDMEPIITGGTRRIVSVNTSLMLEGIYAYDPNYSYNQQHHYMYEWSCQQFSCNKALNPEKDALYNPFIIRKPGLVIKFQLRMLNTITGDISLPYVQTITFVEKDVSEVYIICKKNCGGVKTPAIPGELIYLEAKFKKNSHEPYDEWKWTCRQTIFDEKNNAEVKEVDLSKIRQPGHYNRNLVILAESHVGSDYMYEFSVEGGNPAGQATLALQVRKSLPILEMFAHKANAEGTHYRLNFTTSHTRTMLINKRGTLYFECYQREENFSDVMLFYNTLGSLGYVPIIHKNIYGIICEERGKCITVTTNVEVFKPTLELLKSMRRDISKFFYRLSNLDDALMNMIFVTHYVDQFDDKISFLEEMLDILIQAEIYFVRDGKQYISILLRLLLKRDEYTDLKPVEINLLEKLIRYLDKITDCAKREARYYYPLQAEYQTSTYRELSFQILSCLDIFSSWRLNILLNTDSTEIALKCRDMNEIIFSMFDSIGYLCGRKLYMGEEPILFAFRNFTFWLKANDMEQLSKHEHPPKNISSIYVNLPKTLGHYLESFQSNFYLCIFIPKVNPFWWDIRQKENNFSSAVYITILKPSHRKYVYHTDILKSSVEHYFELSYDVHPETRLYEDNVTMPRKNLSVEEKDRSVLVYKIYTKGWGRLKFSFNFTYIEANKHLYVKYCKNIRPDYNLVTETPDFIVSVNDSTFSLETGDYENNEFYYLGILPKDAEGVNVKFKFKSAMFACLCWIDGRWSSDHCKVKYVSNDRINCLCKHFSGFAATGIPTVLIKSDMPEIPVVKTNVINWWILLQIVLLIILFLLLLFVFFLWDLRDRLFKEIIILEDCKPGDQYPYLMGVYTGNKISCGSSATVGFQLHGSDGVSSRVHILKCSWRKTLNVGSDDWFVFFSKIPIGTIEHLELWQDFTGTYPSWYCRQIIIFDLIELKEYVFYVESWSTVYLKDAVLYYDLKLASEEEKRNRWRLSQNNIIYGLREGHLLLGMIYRHPRSRFYRFERWAVFYLMILIFMTVSLYFQGGFNKNPMDHFQYLPSYEEFRIGIISLFIAFPVVFVISYIFRCSRVSQDNYYYSVDKSSFQESESSSVISWQRVTAKESKEDLRKDISNSSSSTGTSITSSTSSQIFEEINLRRSLEDNSHLNSFSIRIAQLLAIRPFIPIIVTANPENYVYPINWILYVIAWGMTIALIIILTVIILIYACYLQTNKGIKWILSVIIALLVDVLIFEPLFLVFSGVIVACVFQMAYQTTRIKVINRSDIKQYYNNAIDNAIYWKDLRERRSQTCYAPLAVKREKLVRKEMINYWMRKWSLLDFLILFVYLCALFLFVNDLEIRNCSLTTENMKSSLTSPTNTCFGLNEIFNRTMFLKYLSNNLIPKLYTLNYYNGQKLEDLKESDLTGYISSHFHKLIGVPRLRQQRVKRLSCKLAVNLTGLEECNDILGRVEDTSPMINRRIWNENNIVRNRLDKRRILVDEEILLKEHSHFLYTKPTGSYTYGTYGQSGKMYDSGGYIALLGRNKHDSLVTLYDLKDDNWLDELTRVVFFEALFYNVHTNMFTIFVIICENFADSVYVTTVKAFTWTIYNNTVNKIILNIVIATVVLIMAVRFIYLIQLYNYNYFTFITLIMHLLAVITGITACVLRGINIYMEQLHTKAFEEALYNNKFIDFYKPFYREKLQNLFLALFTTFISLRIMFYLQITNNLIIFTKTIEYIVPSGILLIFTFYFFMLAFENITILLENPVMSCVKFSIPSVLEFRQLTKHMLIPQKIFYPFCMCALSVIIICIFRIVVSYYYACATFNRTSNLLALSDKWKLRNLVPYHLTAYRKLLKTKQSNLRAETDENHFKRNHNGI